MPKVVVWRVWHWFHPSPSPLCQGLLSDFCVALVSPITITSVPWVIAWLLCAIGSRRRPWLSPARRCWRNPVGSWLTRRTTVSCSGGTRRSPLHYSKMRLWQGVWDRGNIFLLFLPGLFWLVPASLLSAVWTLDIHLWMDLKGKEFIVLLKWGVCSEHFQQHLFPFYAEWLPSHGLFLLKTVPPAPHPTPPPAIPSYHRTLIVWAEVQLDFMSLASGIQWHDERHCYPLF